MNENVINLTGASGKKRLCMADERYLEWYETYNALPHVHVKTLFSLYLKKQKMYIRKLGKSDISAIEAMQCFSDAATELANIQAGSRYQSAMSQIEDEND